MKDDRRWLGKLELCAWGMVNRLTDALRTKFPIWLFWRAHGVWRKRYVPWQQAAGKGQRDADAVGSEGSEETRFAVVWDWRPMMLRTYLLVAAALLIGARVFIGIVYHADSPTVYLVAKRSPFFAIEQTMMEPIRERFLVLDQDESRLVYQRAYVVAMNVTPWLAAGCLVTAIGIAVRTGRGAVVRAA